MAGNLGHLAATVSLNIDPFRASARTLSSTIKATTAELKAQDIAFKGSEKSVGSMRTVYGTLERQMQQYEAKLKREQKTLAKRSKAVQEGNGDMEKLTTREANAASAVNKTAAQIALLNNRMAAMRKEILLQSNGWTQMSQKAAAFSKVTGKVGSSLASFGSKATMAVTAPIAAGFTAAAKSAIDFNSQIDAIGPLMTNGAAVTGKYRTQLDQLASSSKKWAVQYGISTTSINNGLADLVRAGYSAGQSMKMMPAILDASRASGEDFNGVMEVVTSTMTQFGVKAANTTSVTDAMTYAANATKSGFSDMGEAMQYTGQSAHAAGVSLTETVADIGLLSNAGLQGSTAGTAFNMMLQKLAAASTKADSPMAKLGVNIKAFKAGQIGLPEVIEQVTKATEGKNKVDKVAAVNAAFGERGGRAVLALLNAGAPAMRKLTQETSNAAGATKKVSDMMGNTAAANFNKLKSSVQVLGIEVGENLLPAITPLVAKATEMVQAFGKLDKSTQQSIIKFTLFAAAAGPVSSALGGMFKIISGGAGAFSAVAGGIGRAQTAAKIGASGFDVLKSTFSETAFKALSAAPAIAETGEAATGAAAGGSALLTSLAPLGVALVGVAGAAAVGYGVWKIWGEKAYEAQQRTEYWGTSVNAATDKAAKGFQGYEQDATAALQDTSKSGAQTAKDLDTAFSKMLSSAEKNVVKAKHDVDKAVKDIGGKIGQGVANDAKDNQNAKNNALADMTQYYNAEKAITASGKKLTADQKVQVKNLQDLMATSWVKTLNVNSAKQKQILQVMQANYANMTEKQIEASTNQIGKGLAKQTAVERRNLADLKKLHDQGQLNDEQYNKRRSQVEQAYYTKSQSAMTAYVRGQMKAYTMSDTYQKMNATQRKAAYDGMLAAERQYLITSLGLTKKQADAILKASQKQQKAAETTAIELQSLSGKTKEAATSWNDIVLDPKTGVLKTNAQEEVNKAVMNAGEWNKIKLLIKEGKMSTNATEMVAKAAIANKNWGDLKWITAHAKLNDETKGAIITAMANNGQWDSTDWKTAELLAVSKTGKATIDSLQDMGKWDSIDPTIQQLIAKSKTKADLLLSLADTKAWNDASKKTKEAIFKAIDKASGPARAAKGSVDAFPEKTKKSYLEVTYLNRHIDEYSKIYNKSRTWSDADRQFMGFKKGTNNFVGGLAMVNDAPGAVYREAITLPNGQTFIPKERNAILPLPRHTKIATAMSTARQFAVPRFASGTTDFTGAATTLHNLRPQTVQTVNVTASNENDLGDALRTLNVLVAELLDYKPSISGTVQLDNGREVGRWSAEGVQEQISRMTRTNNRRKGYN